MSILTQLTASNAFRVAINIRLDLIKVPPKKAISSKSSTSREMVPVLRLYRGNFTMLLLGMISRMGGDNPEIEDS